MNKGILLIGLGIFVWAFILTFVVFMSNNPYLNVFLVADGLLLSLCIIAYGFDQYEIDKLKEQYDKECKN